MSTSLRATLLSLTLAMVSCQAPIDSDSMWSDLRGDVGASLAELRPHDGPIRKPLRVGIAPPLRRDRNVRGTRYRHSGPFGWWREEERKVLREWGEKFRDAGLISELVFLPRVLTDASKPKRVLSAVCRAAAQSRVDTVLLVNCLSDVRSGVNALALLDLTIVGMFVVPGHEACAATVAEALLINAKNRTLYTVVEGQGRSSTLRPLAFLDKEALLDSSTRVALDRIGSELLEAAKQDRRRAAGN